MQRMTIRNQHSWFHWCASDILLIWLTAYPGLGCVFSSLYCLVLSGPVPAGSFSPRSSAFNLPCYLISGREAQPSAIVCNNYVYGYSRHFHSYHIFTPVPDSFENNIGSQQLHGFHMHKVLSWLLGATSWSLILQSADPEQTSLFPELDAGHAPVLLSPQRCRNMLQPS